MAGRPPKQHIDFAGWDVNIFDNEPKIDKLLDAHGIIGFGIFFFLCQRAYGSNGYFYEWSYSDASTTARRLGGGAGSQTVVETVRTCLRVGLFDNDLFVECGILTSSRIQKNWLYVAKERTGDTVIIEDYWLLEPPKKSVKKGEKTGSFVFHTLKKNYDPPKLNYDPPQNPILRPYSKG